MSNTPKTGIEELSPTAANQAIIVNTGGYAVIDQLLVPTVIDKDLTAAPGSPVDGAMYIMASAWSGVTGAAAGRLAFWRASAGAWKVITPRVGWRVAVLDELDANGIPRLYGCSASGATSTWVLPESALSNPMTSVGDIILGGASGAPTRLAIGSANKVPVSNGSTLVYGDPPPTGLPLTSVSADKTFALVDANLAFLHPSADTTGRTWTIPANASVAFPVGTMISLANQNAAGAITLAITSDTLRVVGSGATGTRSLAANGAATLWKITATEWLISGTGLS